LTPQISGRLNLPDGTEGAVIVDLESGGAAESGGARTGDVIVSVNRTEVATAADTVQQLNLVESGRTAFLLVQRGPNRVFLQVLKE